MAARAAVKQPYPRYVPSVPRQIIMATMRPILVLTALLLSGCVIAYSSAAMRDSDRRAQAAYADCDRQHQSGKLRSYRLAVECARSRVIAAYQENAYPFMDLVEFDLKARAAGAERIDTGFATPEAVQKDLAELERRLLAERERRMSVARATGGAPSTVPPEQFLAGLDALSGRALPPAGSSCFQIGQFNRCQ